MLHQPAWVGGRQTETILSSGVQPAAALSFRRSVILPENFATCASPDELIENVTRVQLADLAWLPAANIGYYRLASAKFSRMVDKPESHRLERFAGQRVRMVEAVVEVRDRTPFAVVRLVYEILGFDAQRRLAVDRVLSRSATPGEMIVDARSRFVARGGRWQPSPSLEQQILRAALGELKCERL